jgi:hypothetical protein
MPKAPIFAALAAAIFAAVVAATPAAAQGARIEHDCCGGYLVYDVWGNLIEWVRPPRTYGFASYAYRNPPAYYLPPVAADPTFIIVQRQRHKHRPHRRDRDD